MPEGDTILRTARTLGAWLDGREVTAAQGRGLGAHARKLVGRTVERVEARGKHLLIRLDRGLVVHTHMRMSGSWHVYSAGERWRRPQHEARLVVECGERVAVCFNAPVVELLVEREEPAHPALSGLGPDVLARPLDLDAIRARARGRPSDTAMAELLLDQRVVAGIGNIYRSEALFLRGIDPWTTLAQLDDAALDALVSTAAALMHAAVAANAATDRWVYRRARRPCRRCGTPISAKRTGEQARTVYWCTRCQPPIA